MNQINLPLPDSNSELRGMAASMRRAAQLMLSQPGADFFETVAGAIEGELRRREAGGEAEATLKLHVAPATAAFAGRLSRGLRAACSDDELGV